MVLGIIFGIILGSKSHPKIDQKINQILDRFWKDFGSQLAPFWPYFGSKNRSKIKIEKRSIFGAVGGESGVPKVDQGGPIYHRNKIYKDI